MTDPFKPDFRHPRGDLPEGYNDLPEAERAAMMEERVRLLHVYGQRSWHGELVIVGNRNALLVLRDALDAAIEAPDGKAETSAMVADGEGFSIEIERDDRAWDHPAWETRDPPYTEAFASGRPDPQWRIQELEQALRQANAALVKRGVAPVKMPPEPADEAEAAS